MTKNSVHDVSSTHDDPMEALFRQGGHLTTLLDGFEERPEQAALAQQIRAALQAGEVGFFEAGTGTGKSLAYLLPAAAYALEHDARVVVSTHTISLQEQLINKDIPTVTSIYPDLRCTLVKGWSNYICRLRLDDRRFSEGDLLDAEVGEHLDALVEWAETTEDGTRSDLNLPFEPNARLWSEVCAESDSCLRAECPYYQRCPIFRDRAAMAESHLLIVNHHLLLADVALRRALGWETEQAVLPAYEAVIFDEAHHVEDVATAHLGTTLSQLGIEQLFRRLSRRRMGEMIDGLNKAGETKGLVDRFFQAVGGTLLPFGKGQSAGTGAQRWRLTPEQLDQWYGSVTPAAMEAAEHVAALGATIAEALKDWPSDEALEHLSAKGQAEAMRKRLAGLALSLQHFAQPALEDEVIWLEQTDVMARRRLVRSPIDVGPAFFEWASNQCRSLIFLSATLAVGGNFSYYRQRLGFHDQAPEGTGERTGSREALYPSPFDFEEQALLAVAQDLPDPMDAAYPEALAEAVLRFVRASRGRALVLFTSYAALRSVQRAIGPALHDDGFPLLVQGDAPRQRLLHDFKATSGAVLLGTDTFWEGVDVPGEALSLVVVTRLPFDVPTDPIAAARSERVRAEGGSPFFEYALPRAVLKLKQGFGRLIRKHTDRGVVVICDRRVVTKRYGRAFLDALPSCRRLYASTQDVAKAISQFL